MRASFVVLVLVMISGAARAQEVPRCGIVASDVGTRALAEGDRLLLREVRAFDASGTHDEGLLDAALVSYDEACAGGELVALERRATILARMERPLDAIRSLDAFLAQRPLDSLDARLRERVTVNLRALEARVATIDVTTRPAEATVTLDGEVVRRRARVSPGAHVMRVSAAAHVAHEETIELAAGVTTRTVTLSAVVTLEGVGGTRAIPEETVTTEASGGTTTPGGAGETATQQVVVRDLDAQDELEAPLIASLVIGSIASIGAIIAGVWTASAYREHDTCVARGGECGSLETDRAIGLGLTIGAGSLGLLGLAVGIGLAIEDGSRHRTYGGLACGVGPLSIACRGSF